MKHAHHVLHLIGVRVLPAERLRPQDLILADRLVPVNQILSINLVPLAPSTGTTSTALLHGAEPEAARQAVAATILGCHGGLQHATPAQALVAVVRLVVVERHVHLDHARLGLEAQLRGRRARAALVGPVGVLQHEQPPAERQRGVQEDGVRGGDGIIIIVVVVADGIVVFGRHGGGGRVGNVNVDRGVV